MTRVARDISEENLKKLFEHPSILKLRHDYSPDFPIINPAIAYYSAFIDDEFVGAFLEVKTDPIDSEIHVLLFPSSVKKLRELCIKFLSLVFNHSERVTAITLGDHRTMINLAIKLGFIIEGFKRNAFKKSGQYLNAYYLGLLKSEFKE